MRIKIRRIFGMPSHVVWDVLAWICCCWGPAIQESLHVDSAVRTVRHKQAEAEGRDKSLAKYLDKSVKRARKEALRKAAEDRRAEEERWERERLEAIMDAQAAPPQLEMDEGSEKNETASRTSSKSATGSESQSMSRSTSRSLQNSARRSQSQSSSGGAISIGDDDSD